MLCIEKAGNPVIELKMASEIVLSYLPCFREWSIHRVRNNEAYSRRYTSM